MRVIGMLLGIPEEDQEEIRDQIDGGMRLDEGEAPVASEGLGVMDGGRFAEYIDWRADHPVRRPHDGAAQRRSSRT